MRIYFPVRRGVPLLVKALFAPARDPDGAHVLGKTRRKKHVYASGAETGGYNDDDHADAARFHAAAHEYHDDRARHHGQARDGDEDWRRAETHHGEHERHAKLAEHHLGLVRDHLVAAGRGGEVRLSLQAGLPTLSPLAAFPREERDKARKALAARTHHGHPGGLTDQDRAHYKRALGDNPYREEGDDE